MCATGWAPAWYLLQEMLADTGLGEGCPFCGATRPEDGTYFHTECYLAWPERHDFTRRGVGALTVALRDGLWWALVHDDGLVAVTVSIMYEAADMGRAVSWLPAIHLYETGEHLDVPRDDWAPWLAAEGAPRDAFDPGAFARARARLRSLLPTAQSIVEHVDWAEKRQQLLADRARCAQETEALVERRAARRRAFERARAGMSEQRVSCPHCGAADLRVMDVGVERDSFFVCRSCGRSWNPDA